MMSHYHIIFVCPCYAPTICPGSGSIFLIAHSLHLEHSKTSYKYFPPILLDAPAIAHSATRKVIASEAVQLSNYLLTKQNAYMKVYRMNIDYHFVSQLSATNEFFRPLSTIYRLVSVSLSAGTDRSDTVAC